MSMIPLNLCLSCKRFTQETGTCTEWPDSIPEDIFWHLGDHHVSRGGEKTYLPDPDKARLYDRWQTAVEERIRGE